jgi:hypothetical protein
LKYNTRNGAFNKRWCTLFCESLTNRTLSIEF